jgi:hypothetical protein
MSIACPVGAVMNCADNTGAKNLYVISVKRWGSRLNRLPGASTGEMVMATVRARSLRTSCENPVVTRIACETACLIPGLVSSLQPRVVSATPAPTPRENPASSLRFHKQTSKLFANVQTFRKRPNLCVATLG